MTRQVRHTRRSKYGNLFSAGTRRFTALEMKIIKFADATRGYFEPTQLKNVLREEQWLVVEEEKQLFRTVRGLIDRGYLRETDRISFAQFIFTITDKGINVAKHIRIPFSTKHLIADRLKREEKEKLDAWLYNKLAPYVADSMRVGFDKEVKEKRKLLVKNLMPLVINKFPHLSKSEIEEKVEYEVGDWINQTEHYVSSIFRQKRRAGI